MTALLTPRGPSAASHRTRSGALDGIRGLFLAAPIVVHLGLAGSGNGLWLAIGLFFTLSGFLITTLLLGEIDRTGRISLRAFWARRFRRLLPASVLVLFLMVVAAGLIGWPAMTALRGDVYAALTWRANWHQMAGGGYWAGFAPSLTSHFWSLSLEEQLYLVLPLGAVAGVALRRRLAPVRTVAIVSGLTWVVSWWIVWTTTAPNTLYLSTFTRAGEAAAGCFAAAVLHGRATPVAPRIRPDWIIAGIALAEIPVWILSRGDTAGGLRWGITLSTPAVAIVVALLWRHPDSSASRFFSLPALVWLGRRSYGIYLIHIPVFELTAYRLGGDRLPGWAMAVSVAATIVLAGLMFRWVEEPIRTKRLVATPNRFTGLLLTGVGVVAVLAFAAGRDEAGPFTPPDNVTPPVTTVVTVPAVPSTVVVPSSGPVPTGQTVAPTTPGTTVAPEPTTVPAPAASFPVPTGAVLVVGDSTAWVSFGAVRDSLEPLGWTATEVHMVGCPPGGDVRMKNSNLGGRVFVRELGEEPGCDLWWNESLPSWLDAERPSMVVIIGNYGLAYEIDPAGDDQWCRLADGSGRCETWASDRLSALTARILEHAPAAHVVWTTAGHVDPFGPLEIPAAAIDSLNRLVRTEAARTGTSVVDLGSWLDDHLDLTVDGTHLGPSGVAALTPWMATELPAAIGGERLER